MRFSALLRANGVDAWVDEWEMLPGDSLMDKIFEEGLKNASAMVVVLSENSIEKKWVKEELNAGLINRIERGAKVIPIRLDQVEVPQALKDTMWIQVDDPSDSGVAVERVLAAVLESTKRPPLGSLPGIADITAVPGLSSYDTAVLREFGNKTLQHQHVVHVNTEGVWSEIQKLGVDRDSYLESLEVLEARYILVPSKELAPVKRSFKFSGLGFEEFLRHFFPAYDQLIQAVISDLVNSNPADLADLLSRVDGPECVIRHILDDLSDRDLVVLAKPLGGNVEFTKISRRLRRVLE